MEMLEGDSFGTVLKFLRKQHKVSQKELSIRVGVHFNTLSKWERGICLPNSRGMVLEVAKQLHPNQQETRQLQRSGRESPLIPSGG